MYLAHFAGASDEWVQGVATLEQPPRARQWWIELSYRLDDAARIKDATLARRIGTGPGGRLLQCISVVAPSAMERHVREFFASLVSFERLYGGLVELPLTREDHDKKWDRVPQLRLSTTAETFSVGSIPLACDFRMAPALEDLLIAASESESKMTYQLHVRHIDPQPVWSRVARKNALAIAAIPGARSPLVEWQDKLARSVAEASAICEEYLAVDSEWTARSAAARLQEEFRSGYARFAFTCSPFDFREEGHEESLQLGIHSHDLEALTPVDLCSSAVSAEGRRRLLAWQPSDRLAGLISTRSRVIDDEVEREIPPACGVDLPQPCAQAPYVFISYKRQDLTRIAPILQALTEDGIPIWYDRGIPGGAEWDAVIEERLLACRCVLFFASPAAVDSKYVRREIKFADALNTPVLSVLLEDTNFRHGMGMLATQYQTLDVREPDFRPRLLRSLAHLSSTDSA